MSDKIVLVKGKYCNTACPFSDFDFYKIGTCGKYTNLYDQPTHLLTLTGGFIRKYVRDRRCLKDIPYEAEKELEKVLLLFSVLLTDMKMTQIQGLMTEEEFKKRHEELSQRIKRDIMSIQF